MKVVYCLYKIIIALPTIVNLYIGKRRDKTTDKVQNYLGNNLDQEILSCVNTQWERCIYRA